MKTARVNKPVVGAGNSSGSSSPKPTGKSWSKVAAGGPTKRSGNEQTQEKEKDCSSQSKMLDILSGLKNAEAEVTTKTGAKYRGVVTLIDLAASDVAVVLKNATVIQGGVNNGATSSQDIKIVVDDLVEVYASQLTLIRDMPQTSDIGSTAPKTSAWKTDTDISGRIQVKERVLQAWQPPTDDNGFSLEDNTNLPKSSTNGKKWDQFAANEQLFGVKSEWDEDVYTYKLDTSRPDFAQRQAEAERLAREIEQSTSTNAHILEERGFVSDSGTTEEDKYSGVQRSANAWIPPARRPVANLPSPRVAPPVDPAIISSQLAKPGSAAHRGTSSVAIPSSQQAVVTPKQDAKTSNPIETDIMARFKQFATNERDRLSVKKAATFKKEKDGRLQDLLAFSKDFKLKTPVPEDLIPILAKDKAKQDAIIQRAVSSSASSSIDHILNSAHMKSPETKLPDTLRNRIDRAHHSTDVPSAPTPVVKSQHADPKKLKPSAAEFKPFNPTASSFTPTGFSPRVAPSASPALSATSSQPRQTVFSVEAASFFPRKLKPLSERTPISDQFDPFKTFRAKNPDSSLDIETPLKVDPSWPGDEAHSITDAPQGLSRRPSQFEDQFQAVPPHFNQVSQMMFVGSPQQAHNIHHHQQQQQQQQQQQISYYASKNQQFVPVPHGQFVPYAAQPGYVPPQYMYPGNPGFSPRVMQAMSPAQYQNQQFSGYVQSSPVPLVSNGYQSHQSSPRQRQSVSHGQQRSPELHKPTPRPPPMSAEPSKDT